ncbi:MAG: DUF721 domain-containing protein [Alphaproteobacteria bacterium HGW-Alphaproteobacteria-6]|nr:MAG: DUF721 domain-containing protein [Alphaproteobacteria bacterium HGW-Alphaproteobacteria-6]
MTGTGDPAVAPRRRGQGFRAAAALVQAPVRAASEARGFAVTRLLTHWAEVAGADIAAMALPVKVGYGREGFGATLTLLTTGAEAPIVQMRLPQIRDRVNACYGYNAIARIVITQTAPGGFAEGRPAFDGAPAASAPPAPDVAALRTATALCRGIGNDDLRGALEALGGKVLSRKTTQDGRTTKG